MTLKHLDNIDTKRGLKKAIKEFMESIVNPFEVCHESIEEIEYISRDGFMAWDENRGGIDLMQFNNIPGLIGSGGHCGLIIEDKVQKLYEDSIQSMRADNPLMSGDEVEEAYYTEANEYEDIAYRVRAIYNGNKTLTVFAGFDFDAPYFRWDAKADFEKVISFKTINDLKKQLTPLIKELELAFEAKKIRVLDKFKEKIELNKEVT